MEDVVKLTLKKMKAEKAKEKVAEVKKPQEQTAVAIEET